MKQTYDMHWGQLTRDGCEIASTRQFEGHVVKHKKFATLLAVHATPKASGRGVYYSVAHIKLGVSLAQCLYLRGAKGLAENILAHEPFGELLQSLCTTQDIVKLGRGNATWEALMAYCYDHEAWRFRLNEAPPSFLDWIGGARDAQASK